MPESVYSEDESALTLCELTELLVSDFSVSSLIWITSTFPVKFLFESFLPSVVILEAALFELFFCGEFVPVNLRY